MDQEVGVFNLTRRRIETVRRCAGDGAGVGVDAAGRLFFVSLFNVCQCCTRACMFATACSDSIFSSDDMTISILDDLKYGKGEFLARGRAQSMQRL